MIPLRLILLAPVLFLQAGAEPLPPGSYVDFLVVPAGPVRLAEFEKASPPPVSAPAAGKEQDAPPSSGGSGVRVKETDPSEIPPNAVYIRKGTGQYYRIPCFLNAVGVPVRTPVTDSEITFLTKVAGSADSFTEIGKATLTETGKCVLVLLTKPLAEKRWTGPTVTLIPVPVSQGSQVLVANASPSGTCGAVLGADKKILLPALKHFTWTPEADSRTALAMAGKDGGFLAPFFEEYLRLDKGATTLLIAFEVTPQESFRRGKCSTGIVRSGEFRQAVVFPEGK